jgi:hypothetical protein
MQQYSTDNSPVELELLSGHLLFVDPLYFQDIIDNYKKAGAPKINDKRELVKFFEETFFPYGGGGLLGYKNIDKKMNTYSFDPARLKKWDTDNKEQRLLAQQKQITTFGLDTASFLIVDFDSFDKLVTLLTYDNLVDALLANQLDKYFNFINKELDNKGWAYIVSKGVDSKSEFDGDGSYIVD